MSADPPRRVTASRGRVTRGLYAKGSKSERLAVFIEVPEGRLILRRKTGPVFGDEQLNALVGHEVECDGFIVGSTLLAERIDIVG